LYCYTIKLLSRLSLSARHFSARMLLCSKNVWLLTWLQQKKKTLPSYSSIFLPLVFMISQYIRKCIFWTPKPNFHGLQNPRINISKCVTGVQNIHKWKLSCAYWIAFSGCFSRGLWFGLVGPFPNCLSIFDRIRPISQLKSIKISQ